MEGTERMEGLAGYRHPAERTVWQEGFDRFMAEVDTALVALCGMDSMDLPDLDYADRYDAGRKATATARAAIRNAGGEMF